MINIQDLISFKDFDFSTATYRQQEIEILQPQLEAYGFTDINWYDGERDSFGPLTRMVSAVHPDGNLIEMFYG